MRICKHCGGEMEDTGGIWVCIYCGRSAESEASASLASDSAVVARYKDEGVGVYADNIGGVVEITCRFPEGKASGSGFLLDRSGRVITNTHVVTHEGKVCDQIVVCLSGKEIRAFVRKLGDDKGGEGNGIDLALLQLAYVPADAAAVKLGESKGVKNGEDVFVIGNSLGFGTCITRGIVSDKERRIGGKSYIMTDCAVNAGNSGGPMFNTRGEAIGVIVAGITSAEGMNFAIPIDDVKAFLLSDRVATKFSGKFTSPNKSQGLPGMPPSPPPAKECPRCHSKNCHYENGINVCFDCDHEW